MEILIKEITVGERFRKDFEGIEHLVESIRKHGLIEPIILDENKCLIAGERRLKAHVMLKKEKIEAKYINELTELQKKEIELEENIQRKAFTWQEEVNAKKELHEIKRRLFGAAVQGHKTDSTWKVSDTAATLGEAIGTTSQDIQLARGMVAFPELSKERTKTQAIKKFRQLQDRILNEELAKRLKQSKLIAHPDLHCGNCVDLMSKMPAESVDLILTDPPYGIDVDKSQTNERQTMIDTRFADSYEDTIDLLDKAFKEMHRVLKNDRHLYLFFAIDNYAEITRLLLKANFEVHKMPLIWDKGSGGYPSQMTSYVHSYEPILHAWKGNRKLNGTPRDVFQVKRVSSNKKIHPTQKPTELLRDLISFSTTAGELVLDPFAGSGATIVAAKETQRKGIGIELNPVYYEAMRKRLEKSEETVK